MKNISILGAVASVGLATSTVIDAAPARAASLDLSAPRIVFTVDITSGGLAGQSFGGSFTVGDPFSDTIFGGFDVLLVNDFEFDFFGLTADDFTLDEPFLAGGAVFLVEEGSGEPSGLFFATAGDFFGDIETGLTGLSLLFIEDSFEYGGPFGGGIECFDINGDVDECSIPQLTPGDSGAGDVTFVAVPEPSQTIGILLTGLLAGGLKLRGHLKRGKV